MFVFCFHRSVGLLFFERDQEHFEIFSKELHFLLMCTSIEMDFFQVFLTSIESIISISWPLVQASQNIWNCINLTIWQLSKYFYFECNSLHQKRLSCFIKLLPNEIVLKKNPYENMQTIITRECGLKRKCFDRFDADSMEFRITVINKQSMLNEIVASH